MVYCVNPACPNPENLVNTNLCQACGNKLLLQDKYEVVQTLGQGGFGATFIAKNVGLPGSPQCVIKQLRPSGSAAGVMEMARDLFRREAKTLGKIGSHPQIPTLLDYFEQGNEFYLVQEFVSGLTLQQEVKQNGPFTEAGARQFLSEILPLIQYIHSQQVIHRDIKPANIIRRNQDRKLVLIDFGAVKDQVNPNVASLSEQTALTSYAIGTPGYAPPEQMAMRPVYSSDIYALGVTSLYLLTGKSPKDLNYNPATGEMEWRRSIDISDTFANVLAKMLEMSVKYRYQTANEVLKALDMEPYLESLAQGMIKPSTAGDKTAAQAKKPTDGSPISMFLVQGTAGLPVVPLHLAWPTPFVRVDPVQWEQMAAQKQLKCLPHPSLAAQPLPTLREEGMQQRVRLVILKENGLPLLSASPQSKFNKTTLKAI